MKYEILVTVIFLSLLHGLIPSHWVPVMTMKKQYKWEAHFTFRIVVLISIAHILSTVLLGCFFSLVGKITAGLLPDASSVRMVSSIVLFILGIYFIYKHYYHYHFHLYHQEEVMKQKDMQKQIKLLMIGMLFSPCMEITGLYFIGGIFDWNYVLIISLIYFLISFLSSIFWVFFFDALSKKINFHQLEHNSGLLSGLSLVFSAFVVYFI